MEFRVLGEDDTKSRFRQYLAANPAARWGWVDLSQDAVVDVTDDYVEPFREIAANFGLEVTPETTE